MKAFKYLVFFYFFFSTYSFAYDSYYMQQDSKTYSGSSPLDAVDSHCAFTINQGFNSKCNAVSYNQRGSVYDVLMRYVS